MNLTKPGSVLSKVRWQSDGHRGVLVVDACRSEGALQCSVEIDRGVYCVHPDLCLGDSYGLARARKVAIGAEPGAPRPPGEPGPKRGRMKKVRNRVGWRLGRVRSMITS